MLSRFPSHFEPTKVVCSELRLDALRIWTRHGFSGYSLSNEWHGCREGKIGPCAKVGAMSQCQPPSVMVLGCGRSGTSIFGEMFESLSAYHYASEPSFTEVVGADYSVPLAFKVPRQVAAFEAEPGLSFPLNEMQRYAPRMKYFWIVRHPLDAICSLRVGISHNWGHHPKPPDWKAWLGRPLIEQCAHHWAFLNTMGFEQVSAFATVIKFEHIISDPIAVAKSACKTLALNFSANEPSLRQWAGRVQDTNNGKFIEARTSRAYSRADHAVRVGRWRENLTSAEIDSVLPIISKAARTFGYGFADIP